MANQKIGATIDLQGASNFSAKVKSCNAAVKEMESALKLVKTQTSDHANSLDSLTKKYDALKNVLDAQKNKQNELKNAVEQTSKKHEEAAKKVLELQQNLEKEKNILEQMKTAGQASNAEIEQQQKEVNRLASELSKAEQKYISTGNATRDWQTKLNTTEAAIEKTNRELENTGRQIDEARNSSDRCAHSIDEFGNKIKDTASQIDNATLQMQRSQVFNIIQQNIERASSAINKFSREILDVTTSFEGGVAKVATIADQTAVPIEQLSNDMLQLSTQTGRSVSEITEATYQAISASVDTASAVEFVGTATNLAKAGFLETADSVDVLTTIINAYKMSASDASSIADKLVQTQNKGKTTVQELSQSMGQVIPIAAAYNVNLDNLATSYVQLTKQGISTAESGTMLKGMLNELAKEGSNVGDILKEKTGKSFGELMNEGASLGDVLQILYGTVNGNSEAFANLWSNVRAKTGALALAQAGAEEFNGALTEMTNCTGNVSNALDELETPSAIAAKAMNALKNAGASLGDSFLSAAAPAMKVASEAAQDFAKWVNELPGPVKTVVGVLGGLVAVSASVAPKVLAVVNAIKGIKAAAAATAALKEMTAATKASEVATKSLTAALLANPAVAVAAAIASVTVALLGLGQALVEADKKASPYYESLENIKARNEELRESIDSTRSAFEDSFNGAEVTATMATTLKDQLNELMAVEDKDAATKERIKMVVNELNEAIPNLGLAYDSVTDSLNMNNEELERSIQLQEQRLKAAAYEEGYAESLRNQAQAYHDLEQAQRTVGEMTEGWTQSMKDAAQAAVESGQSVISSNELYNAVLNQGMGQADLYTEAFQNLIDAQSNYSDSTEDATWYSEQWNEAQKELGESTATLAETQTEAAGSAQELADANENMSAAARTAMYELNEDGDVVLTKYGELYAAAEESINGQIGLFEDLTEAANAQTEGLVETLGTMDTALESQRTALDTYAENLELAMQYVKESQDLNAAAFVQSITDMGVDGAAQLAAFVEATQTNSDAAADILADFGAVQAAKEAAATNMADLQTVIEEKLTEAAETTKAKTEEQFDGVSDAIMTKQSLIESATQEAMRGVPDGIEEATSDAAEPVKDMVTEVADTIADGSGEVESGTKEMVSTMSDTVREEGKAVEGAMKDTVNDAVAAIAEADFNAPVASMMAKMVQTIGSYSGQMRTAALKVVTTGIIQTFISQTPQVMSSGQELATSFRYGFENDLPEVISAVTSVCNQMQAIFTQYNSAAFSWGHELGSQFAAGIRASIPEIRAAASEAASAAAEYLHHTTPDKGALKGDDKWGYEFSSQIADGISKGGDKVKQASKKLAELQAAGYQDVIEAGKNFRTANLNIRQQIMEDSSMSKPSLSPYIMSEQVPTLVNALASTRNKVKRLKKDSSYTSITQNIKDYLDSIEKLEKSIVQEDKNSKAAIKSAKQSYREAMTSKKEDIKSTLGLFTNLKEEIRDATEDIAKDTAKLDETYEKNRQKVIESTEKSEKSLRDAYDKAVKSRADAISSALSILEKSTTGKAYRKETYTEILKRQVEQLEEYEATMKSLGGKIKNANLLAELQDLGADQLAALQQYDQMTAKELTEYERLYAQRGSIVDRIAKDENKSAEEEMNRQIAAVRKEGEDQLAELKKTYDKEISELNKQLAAIQGKGSKEAIKASIADKKQEMIESLKSQVDGMKEWNSAMKDLEAKVSNKGLLKELEELGIENLEELSALSQMSDKELKQYEKLYEQREKEAQKRAKQANKNLYSDLQAEIKQLKKETSDKVDAIKAEIKSKEKELKKAAKEQGKIISKTMAEGLQEGYTRQIKKLYDSDGKKHITKALGQSIIDGIVSGITGNQKKLDIAIDGAAARMIAVMKKNLGINSPSRVMSKQVGKPAAQGIGVGFEDEMKKVERQMSSAIPTSFDTVPYIDTEYGRREAENNRIVNEVRLYLGDRDVTDMLTERIVKKITSDQVIVSRARGAYA